jgi:hypothetical protein
VSHHIFDHGPIWFDWINRHHWMLDIRLPARWHVSASRWHNRTCHTPDVRHRLSARLFRKPTREDVTHG